MTLQTPANGIGEKTHECVEAVARRPGWAAEVSLGPELMGGSVVAIGRIADIVWTSRFGSE